MITGCVTGFVLEIRAQFCHQLVVDFVKALATFHPTAQDLHHISHDSLLWLTGIESRFYPLGST